jgi:hypothetical protein
MRKVLLVLTFCGFAASLWAADAFVGTWKADISKSKLAPSTGPAVKEWTLVIAEKGTDRESYTKTIYTDGSLALEKWIVPIQGGIIKYQQGGPSKDSLNVVTRISGGEDYWTILQNGKQVGVSRWVVSKDGKTMSGTGKGTDAKGKPSEYFYFCDRQ